MDKKTAIISFMGGCVEIVKIPEGVELIMKDYDVPEDWDEENERCKEDKYGRYEERVFKG